MGTHNKHELILGTSAPDYPPFDLTASGRDYEGFTADYAGILGQTMGLPVKVQRFASRQDAIHALQTGEVDLLGTANGFEASKCRYYAFRALRRRPVGAGDA